MFFFFLIPSIFALDYIIKKKIEETPADDLPKEAAGGFITITRAHNYGMMMNTLDKNPQLVKLITTCSGIGCLIWYIREMKSSAAKFSLLAGALILGGAASNIYDHLFRGYVVDYFKLRIKPIKHVIFNISDFCIFIGCGMITLISFFKKN